MHNTSQAGSVHTLDLSNNRYAAALISCRVTVQYVENTTGQPITQVPDPTSEYNVVFQSISSNDQNLARARSTDGPRTRLTKSIIPASDGSCVRNEKGLKGQEKQKKKKKGLLLFASQFCLPNF